MANNSSRFSALDKAFPAGWLLLAALFITIALMIFCGWRIFLIEGEAREVARERLLLERDKDEFLQYGSELPQMAERHRALSMEMKQFEARKGELADEVRELEEKRASLDLETRDLMGAVKELKAQAEIATTDLGSLKGDMERLKPTTDELRQTLAGLQAQEKALNESIAQKQKSETTLLANIEGLERQKQHVQDLLGRMIQDKSAYETFEKNLSERMAQFEGALAKVGDLNGNYAEKLGEIDKGRMGLMHGLENLNLDLQGVASYLDVVKKDRNDWTAILNDARTLVGMLKTQIDALTENGKKFVDVLHQTEISDKTFQATLLTEAAAINHMTGEDAKIRAQIEKAAASFMRDGEILKNMTAQLQDAGVQIRSLLNTQQGEMATVTEAARDIMAQAEKSRQGLDASLKAGSTLSHSAIALSDQVEEIRTRLKQVDARGIQMDELLNNHADKLKTLTTLGRQLSTEIDENRRQGMLLNDLVTTLQSTMGIQKAKHENVNGDTALIQSREPETRN